jgi:hypothetical protein
VVIDIGPLPTALSIPYRLFGDRAGVNGGGFEQGNIRILLVDKQGYLRASHVDGLLRQPPGAS